jgi:hypothetical protein
VSAPDAVPSPRQARLRVVLAAGIFAALTAARREPVATDVDGLARALSRAAGGSVEPQDIRWAPSEGVLSDLFIGRSAVFLARQAPGAPRDVWRARVRLAPEGTVLSVAGAWNLTQTPLGDDHALVASGTTFAFATNAYGQEQGVTVLDLAGEGAQNLTVKTHDRAMACVTNAQQTGSCAGIARTDVSLDRPADRVGLALEGTTLRVELGDAHGLRALVIDGARGEIASGDGAHAEPGRHLAKRPIFWAVDTVRAVPWIGPAPIAWLEERAFAVRDRLRQIAYRASEGTEGQALADVSPLPPPTVLDATGVSEGEAQWPPPRVPSIWKTPEKGEGEWVAPKLPWMRKAPGEGDDAPPLFYRTFVRPDEARPYAQVLLVAMDMRRLELEMEAGTEDPKPLTGAHGAGRIPRDPAVYTRVVATFNGAFKTEHGNYGMMVHKRVLLPPQPEAATVAVLDDGRVAFGTWGNHSEVGGLLGVPDEAIVSFRQNLDPLVDGADVNPKKRGLWGYTLPGTGVQTERSGLCVTSAGHVIYAWGEDTSATALGKAMRAAGCTYGMHLDMNPHHTGFVFTTIRDLKTRDLRGELLAPQMEISTERYIDYAAKDFFYVMVRDPAPKLGDLAWSPDDGTQPAPRSIPGVFRAEAPGGVSLLAAAAERLRFRVRAGSAEPDPQTGGKPLRELDETDARRVLFAVPMGVATEKRPRGLATGGKQLVPPSGEGTATLVASAAGLSLLASGTSPPLAADVDFVELPLVLDGGVVVPQARLAGPVAPRSALGIGPHGEVVLALATTSSDAPLAEALARAGCARAVRLDRGVRASGALLRAGTSRPPVSPSAETALYALAAPMPPRAFRFQAAPGVPLARAARTAASPGVR